jgi:hypothetical protein
MFRRPDERPDKAISYPEYLELLAFSDREFPALSESIRATVEKHGVTQRILELLRIAFDDMRIVQAGGIPKYYAFPPNRIGTFEVTEKQ